MTTAPRCLAGFVASPTRDPGVDFDLIPEGELRFFSLACVCGGDRFRVRSIFVPHYYLPNRTSSSPITLICASCAVERICFDPTKHGYDVEIDHWPPKGPFPGKVEDFECPACATKTFALTTCFEYFKAPESADMFAYFTLMGNCGACGVRTTMAHVECA
jgi:hypothetical protein